MTVGYWDRRWLHGPPCPGSVGAEAVAKAEWLNEAAADLGVQSLVDWGCGDGTVAAMLTVPTYIGVEVSGVAWKAATLRLGTRPHHAVILAPPGCPVHVYADMAVSMDVAFHLDGAEYAEWLRRVCGSAARWLAVHSTDYESDPVAHMRHHEITADVDDEHWSLLELADDKRVPGWYLWERRGTG